MHYIVYQTTNNLNGFIYVGVHRTTDLNDGYLGSGKKLKKAIEIHGIENFTRVILHFCASEDEMFAKEAEIVNREFVRRRDTYNMVLGGRSKFTHPEYVRPVRRRRRKRRVKKGRNPTQS